MKQSLDPMAFWEQVGTPKEIEFFRPLVEELGPESSREVMGAYCAIFEWLQAAPDKRLPCEVLVTRLSLLANCLQKCSPNLGSPSHVDISENSDEDMPQGLIDYFVEHGLLAIDSGWIWVDDSDRPKA